MKEHRQKPNTSEAGEVVVLLAGMSLAPVHLWWQQKAHCKYFCEPARIIIDLCTNIFALHINCFRLYPFLLSYFCKFYHSTICFPY